MGAAARIRTDQHPPTRTGEIAMTGTGPPVGDPARAGRQARGSTAARSPFAARPPARPLRSWPIWSPVTCRPRSEEHTSELQSRGHLVCRLLLEKKKKIKNINN